MTQLAAPLPSPPAQLMSQLIVVESQPALEESFHALEATQPAVLGIDTETTGLNPVADRLLLVQVSNGTSVAVLNMTKLNGLAWRELAEWLRRAESLFIAHNAKFDFGWLAEKLGDERIMPRLFDTMLAEQLLNSGAEHGGNSLKAVAHRYLGTTMDKTERTSFLDYAAVPGQVDFTHEQLIYAALDVEVLPRIFAKQAHRLTDARLTEVAKLEFDLVKVVSRMERRGVLIDRDVWASEVLQAKTRCTEIEAELASLTGKPGFNARSPKQVLEAFSDLGFRLASTNRETLGKIKHPLAEKLLEWRHVAVLRDRYGDGWLQKLDGENRVHGQFVQIGAATGRFSSRDPNLQQLPRGDRLRKCFIAGPGRALVTADYSQIEIRILAELSQDQAMIDLFRADVDIHAATAMRMFKLPELPAKDSHYRQMAKSVNFGLMYGAGAENLKRQLAMQKVEVSVAQAENLIKLYFLQFPEAKRWLDAQSRAAYASMDDGFGVVTRTLAERRRVFPVAPAMSSYDRSSIARQTRNTPIQGSSADVTKNAMILIDAALLANPEWDAHLLMTIHDEVVVECLFEYRDLVARQVVDLMVAGAQRWMKVCPVKVDVAISDHWSK